MTEPKVKLTRRETEILTLLAQGDSNREIATSVFVSCRTVEFHLWNAYKKLNIHNRAQATRAAISLGLVVV